MTRSMVTFVTLVLFVGWSPDLSARCAMYPTPSSSTPTGTAIRMLEARIACLSGDLTPSPSLPDMSLPQIWRPRSHSPVERRRYLGTYSANRFSPDSIANPYGRFGNRYAPNSLKNRYGRYGSRYSPYSQTNPYAFRTPKVYGNDGTYLGKLSTNRYDPESIANPYGRYGSRYSPDSVNNPYSRFGSRFSPDSATNPYALTPPLIFGER